MLGLHTHVWCAVVTTRLRKVAMHDGRLQQLSKALTVYERHAGLYVEGMESGEEDVAALERRWLKPIYTAAPKLVLRCAAISPSSDESGPGAFM